jgi:uridine kinase
VEIFFVRKDPKKCLVWLHGSRNAGKTTFINLLQEIFSVREFNFKQSYCIVEEASKPWNAQIYSSHEFDLKAAFNDHNFANLKSMWEGKGAKISTNKYEKYEEAFQAGLFIVASNDLPPMHESMHSYYESHWKPMEARC